MTAAALASSQARSAARWRGGKGAYREHTQSPYFRELDTLGGRCPGATNAIEPGSRRDNTALDASAFS
jgi:hypothetical protein